MTGPVRAFWRRVECLASTGILTPDLQAPSLVSVPTELFRLQKIYSSKWTCICPKYIWLTTQRSPFWFQLSIGISANLFISYEDFGSNRGRGQRQALGPSQPPVGTGGCFRLDKVACPWSLPFPKIIYRVRGRMELYLQALVCIYSLHRDKFTST